MVPSKDYLAVFPLKVVYCGSSEDYLAVFPLKVVYYGSSED